MIELLIFDFYKTIASKAKFKEVDRFTEREDISKEVLAALQSEGINYSGIDEMAEAYEKGSSSPKESPEFNAMIKMSDTASKIIYSNPSKWGIDNFSLDEGVNEFFRELHEQGYMIAIFSSSEAEASNINLESAGVSQYINRSFGPEDIGSKKEAQTYQNLAEEMRTIPDFSGFTTDMLVEAVPAKAAGYAMSALFVPEKKEEIEVPKGIVAVDNLRAIQEYLN